jgi:hypothetical protein
MSTKVVRRGKRGIFYLTLAAASLLALSEGGFLAYLLSLREALKEGSSAAIVSIIAMFCTGLFFILYGRHVVNEKASLKSTREGLECFVRNIGVGVVTPRAMSQIFLSSISAGLPSDIHKTSLSRVKAMGGLITCFVYGAFLLYLEPLLFITSSCVAISVLVLKVRINLDIIYLSNKRLLSIVRMYRNVKEIYTDKCSEWFEDNYKSAAEEIVSVDHKISRKQFESSLVMIVGRALDFGICLLVLLNLMHVESIVYFLLVNLTRDIFLRSSGAILDSYVEAAIKGRMPNKVSNDLSITKREAE